MNTISQLIQQIDQYVDHIESENISSSMSFIILTKNNEIIAVDKKIPNEIYKIAKEHGYQINESSYYNGKLHTYTFIKDICEKYPTLQQ